MIKLKKLIKESTWDRKFGEPLPTLSNVMEKHGDCGCGPNGTCECDVNEENITESKWNFKVLSEKDIDSRTWRQMKYDLRDQFDELVKGGEDFGVFASAQGTHRMLKQIKKIMDKI